MEGTLRIEVLLAASTLIDVAAVVIACWAVRAGARQQAAARATLERLGAQLGELIADAERRGAALEGALGAREKALRALLNEAEKLDDVRRSRPRRDAAEARLLRDLELRLASDRGP